MTHLRLYVNVDHVATLRQARRTVEPNPADAVRYCENAGAQGITAHLREDRRHITDADLPALVEATTTVLNLELSSQPSVVEIVAGYHPYQATLVPERREEVTTEGGLDLTRQDPSLRAAIRRLDEEGIRVSLFIDPGEEMIDRAKDLGVPAIELHTGRYSHEWQRDDSALDGLRRAAAHAADLGLAVHAGHGLTYGNVTPVATIPEIEELNIGHSIMSRAMFTGMSEAVSEMVRLLRLARPAD